jgi:hypothetical protein
MGDKLLKLIIAFIAWIFATRRLVGAAQAFFG